MFLHPYLESIYNGQVTVSIVADNACSHAKRDEPKRRAGGMRRCMTAPDLGSRQLLYKRRSSLDDSSTNICRWDSSPSSPMDRGGDSRSRRLSKDLPPVLKRSVGGPPVTLKKSTSLSSMGDRPPTYIRRKYCNKSSGNNSSPNATTLLVINEVLNTAMDGLPDLDSVDELKLEEEECEIPEEALSF